MNDVYLDGCDPWLEAFHDEEGAKLGDPRRCLHHPHIATSSPDGMHDSLCGACEAAADETEVSVDELVELGVCEAATDELTEQDIPF